MCSGRGICLVGTGVCECVPGYSGAACELCATGYQVFSPTGGCVMVRPCAVREGGEGSVCLICVPRSAGLLSNTTKTGSVSTPRSMESPADVRSCADVCLACDDDCVLAVLQIPPPACSDGVQNGVEDGVDCGNSCENPCPVNWAPPSVRICVFLSPGWGLINPLLGWISVLFARWFAGFSCHVCSFD